MAWQPLPDGVDIAITAPNFYAVVAQVGAQHSRDDIIAQAAKRGLSIFDYHEDAADSSGYRQVAVQAQATASGATLPWSPGFPASLAAHYHLTHAWWSPPTDAPSSPQPQIKASSNDTVVVIAVALVAAAIGGYLWLRRR